jgi:hypothetical protein
MRDEHRASPLVRAWLAVGTYVAYAFTVGTMFFFRTQAPGLPVIVLHVSVASTCYAYVSALSCRSCGASLTNGALGFGRRCRKCGHSI